MEDHDVNDYSDFIKLTFSLDSEVKVIKRFKRGIKLGRD